MKTEQIAQELVEIAEGLTASRNRTAKETPFLDAVAKVWRENRALTTHPAMKKVVRKYDIIEVATAFDDALNEALMSGE